MNASYRKPVGSMLGGARRPRCRQARVSDPGGVKSLRACRRLLLRCGPRCRHHVPTLRREARRWIRNRVVSLTK